jgi:hypothetical protein
MHAARWPEHAAKQKPEASRLRGMYDSEQDIHAERDAYNNASLMYPAKAALAIRGSFR